MGNAEEFGIGHLGSAASIQKKINLITCKIIQWTINENDKVKIDEEAHPAMSYVGLEPFLPAVIINHNSYISKLTYYIYT